MGVIDNLKKIRQSYENKNAVSRIARKAVQQGAIETNFLSEYNSFSVSLKEVLEKRLVLDGHKSLTISATDVDGKGENLKYFNYLLEDKDYTSVYEMDIDKASNVTFRLKYVQTEDVLNVENDNTLDNDFKKDIDFFLNN